MNRRHFFPHPLLLPVLFFGITILLGACLLHLGVSHGSSSFSWTDALFTATSATCVTGLVVVDTGSFFTPFGQCVIMILIQIGGLGIMTLTSLAFYLMRQRVSLTDRIAVGQNLLFDAEFNLGRFLVGIVALTFSVELIGAVLLFMVVPENISSFHALFHSISAFCNAGFSLYSDSLMRWQSDIPVNLIFIGLIILGGLGFSVLAETGEWVFNRLSWNRKHRFRQLAWYAKVVLSTTLVLLIGGWIVLFFTENIGYQEQVPLKTALVTSLFQSVTCRTAGFNTVEIGSMTNVSLMIMMFLMWVGGAPGSTAGGVKVTTLRVLTSFYSSQIMGRKQAVIGAIAVNRTTVNKALVLTLFSLTLLACAVLLLHLTEGGDVLHSQSRGLVVEIAFEVTSALGTAGLSTGLTGTLSFLGKYVIIVLMFVGRLGPLIFLALMQELQSEEVYYRPEGNLLIG
ncbi:MAG TPA: potassium transporter TrkH [Desulfobacterales bacterium]|nr:potassium transporter TrkH [Desulfobacterales bacterium]